LSQCTGLAIEYVPLHSVRRDPANARKHTPKNLQAIESSIVQFGVQGPIVVDRENVIVSGNGRHHVFEKLGLETIPIVRTDLSPREARAFAILDNQSASLATWNVDALAKAIDGLRAEAFDIEALAFGKAELDKILQGVDSAVASALSVSGDDAQAAPLDPGTGDDAAPIAPSLAKATAATEQPKYPLSIVLTRSEYGRWQALKKSLGASTDKDGLLKILDRPKA
jgi:ParB-like chromosome segregation protein Spo0J